MRSEARIIAVLAGTQSGKTFMGPRWLWREILYCGEGDYIAVTGNYKLYRNKMLPSLREWFEYGHIATRYYASDNILEVKNPKARIILCSAESPEGLEAATANAAWGDEAGMDSFTLETHEAIMRRLSLSQGRLLYTTTIYNLGWLKSHIYDRWRAGDPGIDVIQFDSTANPAFPKAEYERARASMPLWKFNMFYRGRFERPAGLIYDCFDENIHIRPRFAIPAHWPRYVGLDFGGVNTAAVFFAAEVDGDGKETGRLFVYREYKSGGRTAADHARALLEGEPMTPFAVGGSKSEGQWRWEFAAGGLGISGPLITDVEVGIQRVYGAIKRGELLVFADCTGVLDELRSYSRVLGPDGEATEKIDEKSTYHHLDAVRYLVSHIKA